MRQPDWFDGLVASSALVFAFMLGWYLALRYAQGCP